jgi:hypothetical protein
MSVHQNKQDAIPQQEALSRSGKNQAPDLLQRERWDQQKQSTKTSSKNK